MINESSLYILIPAYEPNEILVKLIFYIKKSIACHIVVVDDGSTDKSVFKTIENDSTVLTHKQNLGKGAALKTGFNYILSLNDPNIVCVTADADGQHRISDIVNVYYHYKKVNSGIVIGSRVFNGDVPKRSQVGNNVSKLLYRLFYRVAFNDNQSGLRAFDYKTMQELVNVPFNRYEYEMNMLTYATFNDIPIHEIGIETIYINNNASSHFRPFKDFYRIVCSLCYRLLPFLISMSNAIIGAAISFSLFDSVSFSLNTVYTSLVSYFCGLISYIFFLKSGIFIGKKYNFANKKSSEILFYFIFYYLISICLFSLLFGLAFKNIFVRVLLAILLSVGINVLINYLFPVRLMDGDNK